MRVFIVDDSKVIVERVVELLRDVAGAQVVGRAGDVPEAIDGILRTKAEAIILDLQLPGGSGLDVLRAVRMNDPGAHVMICTNYAYSQYREECLSAGANYFLDKSSEFEKIPYILRDLIESDAKATPANR